MMMNNIHKPKPSHEVEALLEKAAKCRRMVRDSTDKKLVEDLIRLANDYESQAVAIVDAYIREQRDPDG
jgi:hypothetical protein